MISLILPWPVSINAYWKQRAIMVRGKPMATTYVSSAGKQFQVDVAKAVEYQLGKHEPIEGRLSVSMQFFQPNARRCDISNFVKTTEDALTKAGVWVDDEQVDYVILVRKPISRDNPRVEVAISVLKEVKRLVIL